MRAEGIEFAPLQTSLSRNTSRHTMRGMHFTRVAEAKLVRCTQGSVFDVALDLRSQSPTFGKWVGLELDAKRANAIFIPSGVAHGFLTLEPESDVLYQIDRIYQSGFDAGVRWNDPFFGIKWPAAPQFIHPRDASYPDYRPPT